jgi:ankyrin repeat protein
MEEFEHPNADVQREYAKLKAACKKIRNPEKAHRNRVEQLRCAVVLGASDATLEALIEDTDWPALQYQGDDDEEESGGGITGLDEALDHGNTRMLKLLLKHGMQVISDDENYLVYVASHGPSEDNAVAAAELLLQHDRYAVNTYAKGFTPLMAAARRGKEKLVRLFLGAGAAALGENVYRRSALFYAHLGGHEACARLIEAAMERVLLAPREEALENAKAALAASIAAVKASAAENRAAGQKRKRAEAVGAAE